MPALLRWFLVLLACLFSWKGSCSENQIQFHLGNKTWIYGCEIETNASENNGSGSGSDNTMENLSSCDPFFTRGCTLFSRLNEDKSPLYRISSARVHLEGGSGLRTNSTEVLFSMNPHDDDDRHLCNFTIEDEGKRLDIWCDPFVAGRYLIVRFKETFDMRVCPVEENVSISVQTESLFLPIPINLCLFQANVSTVSCPIRGLSSFNVTDIIIQYDNRSRGQLLAYASSQNVVTREDESCTIRRRRDSQIHLSCNSPRRSEYVLLELPQGANLTAIQVYYIDDLGSPVVNMSVQWSGSVFEVNCAAVPPANSFWKSNVKLIAFQNGNFSKATLQGSVDFLVAPDDKISLYTCEASILGGTTVVALSGECQWTSFQNSSRCQGLEEVRGQQRKRNCTVTYGNNETETGQTRPERFCKIKKGNSGCNSESEADTVILCSSSTETSITILLGTRIPFPRVALVDSNEKKPVSVPHVDQIDTNVYRANVDSLAPFISYNVTVNSVFLPPVIVTKKVSNLMVSHVERKDFVAIKWNASTLLKARPLLLSIYNLTFEACTASDSCPSQPTDLLARRTVGTFEFNLGNYLPFRNYAVVLSADYLSTNVLRCFRTRSSKPTEPPQNIDASSRNPTQITVVWDPPPCQQQNGVIRRYCVIVRNYLNVVYNDSIDRLQQERHSVVVGNLSAFTSYSVKVAAATENGIGQFSSEKEVETDEDKPSGAPLNVSASSITSTTFNVTWSPPAENKRNGILTGYRISINMNISDTTQTFWMAKKLDPASHYDVSVRARTRKGFGPPSQPISVTTKDEGLTGPVRAAIIVAAVFSLVVIIIIVLLVMRTRKKHKRYNVSGGEVSLRLKNLGRNDSNGRRSALVIARHHSFTKVPIAKEDFESYLEELGDLALREEFEWLPVEQEYPWESATEECNAEKNRYIDILPYDYTRVKLSPIPDEEGSDYINATLMNGFEDFGAYIVTQGPLENTTTDFWRMVWQQKAQAIVMLTNLEEKGRLKCHCYWPQDGSLSKHGALCVAHQSTTVYADYVLRRFVVSMDDDVDNKSLDVVQYHYISWPDHGVPTDTGSVLNFLTRIRRNKNSNSGPMIVHCSAGVGRTGAFITIDTMLQRLSIHGDVDVYNYVLKLRERRVFMVQTAEQYIFIHQTIQDAIQWGDTSIPVAALKEYVTYKMEYVNGFKAQFDMLGKCPVLDESAAQKPTNMTKNRYRNYVPNNSFRVTLSLPAFGRSSDYINASHVSSLLHKDFFKIAQTPVEESVEDFWRMMWDQRCSIVVLMCHLRQGDEEHCFQFWPDSDALKFKTFHVELEKETKGEHVTVREMKLVHSKTSTSNLITCFHFLDWPCEDKPPESAESLVSLIVDVQKQQAQSGNRPMAVICNNGVGRSGVFACLYSTIERMRCDRMVDIFQTVRAMRLQRSRLISNLELYKFCYKGALEYASLFKDNDDD